MIGAISANHALLAKRRLRRFTCRAAAWARARWACLDLGINTMDDVPLTCAASPMCDLPLLVDIDTGFGPRLNN